MSTHSLRSSPSSLSTSPSSLLTPSASVVQVGGASLSPGDALVESLLPLVAPLSRPHKTSTGSSSPHSSVASSKRSSHGSRDSKGIDALPLAEHPAVLQAQDECCSLQSGNDVRVLEDLDVHEPVVQVLGRDAELVLPTRNAMRFLVLFVKNLGRFFSLRVVVLDDKRKYREFTITNARSLARVDLQDGGGSCQLPLLFGGDQEGWRYACLDLQALTREAFGAAHVATTLVRVGGDCRVLRVFFQDERYADAELPPHLTFLG